MARKEKKLKASKKDALGTKKGIALDTSKTQEGVKVVTKYKRGNRLKRFAESYDIRMLLDEVNNYGYSYSFKNFALASIGFLAAAAFIAWYMGLQTMYVMLLCALVILMVPIVIRAQFRQLYQIKRFDMVTGYLDNIIPIFKKTPIITTAWAECIDLLDGEMKEAVQKAYNRVMTNTDDPNVLQTAFSIIEGHFPNSRIHSVHQMMYSVETKNTKNFASAVDNIWLDVRSWIMRTTGFQKELKDKKSQLTLLSLLAMAAGCFFTIIYGSSNFFEGFEDNVVYQVSTFLCMSALLIVMCVFQVKLSGKWLLDDKTVHTNDKAVKSFNYVLANEDKPLVRTMDKILGVVCLVGAVACYIFTKSLPLTILCVLLAYMLYSQNRRLFASKSMDVSKFLEQEFPVWLRDISLNLQTLTVINAIEASKATSSPIMCYHIDKLLDELAKNPASIKPFNDFLDEYKMEGVKSSMKVLYSLQTLDKDEMQGQISSIIERNQSLLEKSERLRNESSISGIKLLGFIPIVVFIVQLVVNMFLLVTVLLNLMSNVELGGV